MFLFFFFFFFFFFNDTATTEIYTLSLHDALPISLPGLRGNWRHRRKDGTLIEVEITRSPVVFEGKSAWLVLAHDITARQQAEAALRESEARFQSTFENAAAGMCTTDTDGRFLRVNPVFCRFLGYGQSELLKLTMANVTHPD